MRDGNTTLPLLWAAHLSGGTLWSVDKQKITYQPPAEIRDAWHPFQSDALHFLECWSRDVRIDVAFIDDDHAYPHVKRELELLDPLVGPGSLVLIHDTMIGRVPYYYADLTLKDGQWQGGGPYPAIAELNPELWEFSTLPITYGLTILRKKRSKHGWNI